MSGGPVYRFGDFLLDVADRRLTRGRDLIDLAPRYFDALALLVGEEGRLVAKDRFFAEVWGDVAVGDEALTQCVKTLRRQLGDDAANPRFIQTVPKHGYRFIAEVVPDRVALPAPLAAVPDPAIPQPGPAQLASPAMRIVATSAAAALGGALTGLVGALLYGALLIGPADAEVGSTSFAALLVALNVLVGGLGGLGVGLGYAVATAFTRLALVQVAAAALGGLAVGTLSRLLGLDAFNLLLGEAPVGITGGPEGAVVAGLIVLGFVAVRRDRHRLLGAAIGGAVAGIAVVIAGGRMMAGSLELIAAALADSGVVEPLAPFLANADFGDGTELVLAVVEGLVFGAGVAAALILVHRRTGTRPAVLVERLGRSPTAPPHS